MQDARVAKEKSSSFGPQGKNSNFSKSGHEDLRAAFHKQTANFHLLSDLIIKEHFMSVSVNEPIKNYGGS